MRCTLFASDKGDVAANLAFTNNYTATAAPTASDDTSKGYQAGSKWIYNSTVYECVNPAAGAAVWLELAAAGATVPNKAVSYSAANNATGFTATAAQVSGGSSIAVLDLTGAPGAAENLQLPTVAALVAALGEGAQPGDSYILRVKNSGNTAAWTVTTNTGWTLTGTMSIGATPNWRDFAVTLTSLTAATLQDIGGGNVV